MTLEGANHHFSNSDIRFFRGGGDETPMHFQIFSKEAFRYSRVLFLNMEGGDTFFTCEGYDSCAHSTWEFLDFEVCLPFYSLPFLFFFLRIHRATLWTFQYIAEIPSPANGRLSYSKREFSHLFSVARLKTLANMPLIDAPIRTAFWIADIWGFHAKISLCKASDPTLAMVFPFFARNTTILPWKSTKTKE